MAPRQAWSLLVLAPFAVVAAGCVADASEVGDEQDTTATTYVGATAFMTTQAEKDAWKGMITRIGNEFGDVCGDTFCGGDYSNLLPLDFTCAVSSKVGQIHDCLWTFGGTSEMVNPTTGLLQVSKPSFQCHVKTTARVSALITTLTQDATEKRAIRRVLPGTTTSIYDQIGECFQHPIGTSPLTNVNAPTESYAIVADAPATNVDDWFTAEAALRGGFAADCAGSFCKGKYDNLEALRVTCAVAVKTGNIKSCAMMVAGSKASVSTTKGTVSTDFTSYRCSLPMKGSPNDLSALILADSPTPMLDRVLPGSTKTIRQSLDSCL